MWWQIVFCAFWYSNKFKYSGAIVKTFLIKYFHIYFCQNPKRFIRFMVISPCIFFWPRWECVYVIWHSHVVQACISVSDGQITSLASPKHSISGFMCSFQSIVPDRNRITQQMKGWKHFLHLTLSSIDIKARYLTWWETTRFPVVDIWGDASACFRIKIPYKYQRFVA